MASDPGVLRAEPDGVSIVRLACYRGRAELGARLVELGAEVDPFDAAALGDVDRLRPRAVVCRFDGQGHIS